MSFFHGSHKDLSRMDPKIFNKKKDFLFEKIFSKKKLTSTKTKFIITRLKFILENLRKKGKKIKLKKKSEKKEVERLSQKIKQKKSFNSFSNNIETTSWGGEFSLDYNRSEKNLGKKILKCFEKRSEFLLNSKVSKKIQKNDNSFHDEHSKGFFGGKNIDTTKNDQTNDKKLEKKVIILTKKILEQLRAVYFN
jgi:hypothetical protein